MSCSTSFECAIRKFAPVSDPRDLELVEQTLRSALWKARPSISTRYSTKRGRKSGSRPSAGDRISRLASPWITRRIRLTHSSRLKRRIALACSTTFLSCLDREGVSIALSRISTQAGAAIDTFYVAIVRTHTKITDSSRIAALQKHLQAAAMSGAG